MHRKLKSEGNVMQLIRADRKWSNVLNVKEEEHRFHFSKWEPQWRLSDRVYFMSNHTARLLNANINAESCCCCVVFMNELFLKDWRDFSEGLEWFSIFSLSFILRCVNCCFCIFRVNYGFVFWLLSTYGDNVEKIDFRCENSLLV